MNEIIENNLIEQCREGNSEAFGRLIKIYRSRLFSYLIKICGDKTSAEDLFQETLIKIWKGINTYSNEHRFSAWLFSIAHNTAVDHLRKKKARDHLIYTDKIPSNGKDNDPHHKIVNEEINMLLEKTISELPEKQRHVFYLRQFGDMKFKDIADAMNEPLNTVLSHMRYAMDKLRKALKETDEL